MGNIFSRRHFEIFFLFFSENRLWHFMQIVQETICMKCQSLFSGKNKKNIIRLSSAEIAQRVFKDNETPIKWGGIV